MENIISIVRKITCYLFGISSTLLFLDLRKNF